MRILVSQKDIDNGVPRSSSKCPVALSLRRRFKGEVITVERYQCFVGAKQYNATGLREFTLSFDEGFMVRPKFFVLREVV